MIAETSSDSFTLSIAALTRSASVWEFAGYCSTALVAVGCVGEAIHDFTKWHRGDNSWWDKNGSKLSVLVLVAALASELITQVQTNNINGRITAILNQEAASARLELEQIKEKQRPRTLTPNQRQHIIAALKAFAGQKVDVTENRSTNEAVSLSKEIVSALEQAGWQAKVKGGLSGVPGKPEIQVFVYHSDPAIAQATALANALLDCGYTVKCYYNSDVADQGITPWPLEKGTIGLIVGPKE